MGGGWGLTAIYVLAQIYPPPPKPFPDIGPPVGGKFAELRRLRVSGRDAVGIKYTCCPYSVRAT